MDTDDPEYLEEQRVYAASRRNLRISTSDPTLPEASNEVWHAGEMDQDPSQFLLGTPTTWGGLTSRTIPSAAFDSNRPSANPLPSVVGFLDLLQLQSSAESEVQNMARKSLGRTVQWLHTYTDVLHDGLSQLLGTEINDDARMAPAKLAQLGRRHANEVAGCLVKQPAAAQLVAVNGEIETSASRGSGTRGRKK